MLGSRTAYYLSSLPTLMRGIVNWSILPGLLLSRRPVTVKLRGGLRFLIRGPLDLWILKEVALDRDYSFGVVVPNDGWRVVDVGAGLGAFSVLTGSEFPNSEIVAVEPESTSFHLLTKNLALNQVTNVRPVRAAIAAHSGPRRFRASPHPALAGTTSAAEAPQAEIQARMGQQLEGLTLGDLFDRFHIDHCDLLKMDCEGDEFGILLDGRIEDLQRIRRLSLEYHDGVDGHHHSELVARLESLGFDVHLRSSPAHSRLGFLYAHRLEEGIPTHPFA
jgi:FkbM family methyltransferase